MAPRYTAATSAAKKMAGNNSITFSQDGWIVDHRPRRAANPNAAPSARHVLDDDGLTKRCTHALGHNTSNNICGPASSKRHDHCDRPRRIGLAPARDAGQATARQRPLQDAEIVGGE